MGDFEEVTGIALPVLEQVRRAGFDKAVCQVCRDELHELQAENGDINLFRTNFETDISLSGIEDHRKASIRINRSDRSVISDAIDRMKTMVRGTEPDPAHDIAEEQPAEQFLAGPDAPDYDLMYDRVREVQDHVARAWPTLNLRNCGVTFYRRRATFVNTNGVRFESVRGQYRVSVSFSAREGTDTSSMMYTGYSRFELKDEIFATMNIDDLFRQSTEQVRTSPLPRKFEGDLVIAPMCLPSFLGFLTSRISDGPIISGTSVYREAMDELVASKLLTLHSAPVSPEICSGYWVTGDGYKAENSTLIDEGRLCSFLLSLYGEKKTGLTRAVNGGGCYIVEPGQHSFAELIKQVDEGILINRFSGGRPNDRGDFSGIAKNSYYIRDGIIQYPVRETTVSGNLVDLLRSIEAVSKERLDNGTSLYPWIRASGVTAS